MPPPLLLDDELVDIGTGVPPVVSPPLPPRPKLLIAIEIVLSWKIGLWLPLPIRPERVPLEWKMEKRLVTCDLATPSAPQ
jgi:hypothetical protein